MNYEELQQGIQENLPIPDREELCEAIKSGNLEKYTPKQIEQGMLQEYRGNNLYMEAACHGYLDKVPKNLLTAENLAPDDTSLGPLYFVAKTGYLHHIPKELLTEENLTKPDSYDWTPLHYAATHGQLDLVPKEVLTEENLTKPDDLGHSPFYGAAYRGHLNQIPKKFLTARNLTTPDKKGYTPLTELARSEKLHTLPLLPYKTLLELKTLFEGDSEAYQEKILPCLQSQIQKHIDLKTIANSLKKNHEEIP
jgi:hypothetical protein